MITFVSSRIAALVSSRPPRFARALGASVCLACLTAPALNAATIVASNTTDLQTALTNAAAGDTVLARAGVYVIAQPLLVKDGVTLRGEGTMRLGADGLPTGFDPVGETVLQAAASLVGDLLTLGSATSVNALAIRDVAGRAGVNVLTFASRAPAEVASASIVECEIFNPHVPGIGPEGPTGRSVVVVTRNPNPAGAPPPHDGSVLTLRMTRSLVRATEVHPTFGNGFWAHNFSSRSKIDLVLTQNVFGGGLELIGGNSRPEAATGSTITLESRNNLYRSDGPTAPQPFGWLLICGNTATIAGTTPGSPTNNRIEILSVQDRIEGFQTGIFATGARRPNATVGPARGNHIELSVQGARLRSTVRDFTLLGSESLTGPVGTDTDNTIRLLLSNTTGSGVRDNVFSHGAEQGTGNRVEIVGSASGFAASNPQILAVPASDFFTSGASSQAMSLSARGVVSPTGPLIVGLVVTGRSPKRFLLRATGPALAAFGVGGALADPALSIYSGTTAVVQNDNWSNNAGVRDAALLVGAFGLAASSNDAALVQTLNPGVYTLMATGVNGATGAALIEAYELP